MKCPACRLDGTTSKIDLGYSVTSLMSTHSFYDEDGRSHFHDPNKTTAYATCSNGHELRIITGRGCAAAPDHCDVVATAEIEVIE